jgi:hypothetical protein
MNIIQQQYTRVSFLVFYDLKRRSTYMCYYLYLLVYLIARAFDLVCNGCMSSTGFLWILIKSRSKYNCGIVSHVLLFHNLKVVTITTTFSNIVDFTYIVNQLRLMSLFIQDTCGFSRSRL